MAESISSNIDLLLAPFCAKVVISKSLGALSCAEILRK